MSPAATKEGFDTGKTSRDKGAKYEREVVALFKKNGYDVHRGGAMHISGALSPDVYGAPGIHIECKRYKNLFGMAYKFLAQSAADKKADELPIVVYRADNCKSIVFLDAEDFITIYRSWESDGCPGKE